MRVAVHISIALQLVGWTAYMIFAYLAPDHRLPEQSLEGFLFLCIVGIVLCFIPALRMAKSFELQPFAFLLTCLPIVAVAAITIAQLP